MISPAYQLAGTPALTVDVQGVPGIDDNAVGSGQGHSVHQNQVHRAVHGERILNGLVGGCHIVASGQRVALEGGHCRILTRHVTRHAALVWNGTRVIPLGLQRDGRGHSAVEIVIGAVAGFPPAFEGSCGHSGIVGLCYRRIRVNKYDAVRRTISVFQRDGILAGRVEIHIPR